MGDSVIKKCLERIDPRLQTTTMSKPEVDFQLSICHRFGKVLHAHAWHVDRPDTNQTFSYETFIDVVRGADSWLEAIEIIHSDGYGHSDSFGHEDHNES